MAARPSATPRPSRALQLAFGLPCLLVVAYSQIYSGPYRKDLIGQYYLPEIQDAAAKPECNNFFSACAAEAAGQFDKAMQMYEEKYAACGDYGWNVTGHANGSNDFVVFKRTPCGLHVAIKPARTGKECRILRDLTNADVLNSCPGCFPRYYHLSNFTHACYSQYVLPAPMPVFRPSNRNIDHIKSLYLQLIHIIRVLRAHNLEHRDLSFRNLLTTITATKAGGQQLRLVMFDFGCAKPLDSLGALDAKKQKQRQQRKERQRSQGRRLDGNGLHTDIYAASCTFMDKLYNEPEGLAHEDTCWREIPPLPLNASTMRHALIQVMMDNDNHTVQPQYHRIRALIDAVSTF